MDVMVFAVCCAGVRFRQRGVEDGALPLGGHHGPRAALSAGRDLAALGGQRRQLEGVQLHTGTHTHADTTCRHAAACRSTFALVSDERMTRG